MTSLPPPVHLPLISSNANIMLSLTSSLSFPPAHISSFSLASIQNEFETPYIHPIGRCFLCKEDHFLMFCFKYKAQSAQGRKHHVESNNLCANCLLKHKLNDCATRRTCSVCSERHHTSLHDSFCKVPVEAGEAKLALVAHSSAPRRLTVLLATARIRVIDRFGHLHDARALVDWI